MEEQDVHTGWRRYLTSYQRAGKVAKAKRRTNRRERREGQRDTRREAQQSVADAIEAGGWYE